MRRDPRAPKKGYTANSYIRILRDGLLPILETESVSQQDGAEIHRAKATKKFFKNKCFSWIQDWPPYSPDLNPIEHCWPMLKEHMYRLYPDMETWKGSDEAIQERMEDALVHAWDQMRTEMAHNLVNSMKERIEAVITSKGWCTRF